MAAYDTDTIISFISSGGTNYTYITTSVGLDLTFDDGESDGYWPVGEVINDGSPSDNVYLGSMELTLVAGGTVTVPVIDNGSGSMIAVNVCLPDGLSATDVVIPSTLDIATLSPVTFTVCFGEGTAIATPGGEVAVEDLRIGDTVLAHDGAEVAVKWVGRQTLLPRFNPAARNQLIRIAKGALGEGLPRRDLVVTARHGMLLDGVICNAHTLVNGETITVIPWQDCAERVTVYHIETEGHQVILAEGAASETYVDNGCRRGFDNYAEYLRLYGEPDPMEDAPYPRVMSARQLPRAVAERVSARAKRAA